MNVLNLQFLAVGTRTIRLITVSAKDPGKTSNRNRIKSHADRNP